MNFLDTFKDMGLEQVGTNSFHYEDQYSHVLFEKLKTCDSDRPIPALSVWTKGPTAENYLFQGIVSMVYNFIGNNIANNRIRESVSEIKIPIFREYTILNSPKYTFMQSDILIQNANNIPEIGDVYPHVTVRNSYNGRSGVEISFGISFLHSENIRHSLSFRQKMVSFKQVHSQYSKTKLISAVGNYVNVVSLNILDLIKENFETIISDDTLLSTLDMVEKLGQRRRENISDIITTITKDKPFVTCWDLFLAITKFSTIEKNLNARVLLEDIVERTLVIPVKMMKMMDEINKDSK